MIALKICYRVVLSIINRLRNLINSFKIFYKALKVKAKLFFIWLGKRKEIGNWFKSWNVEISALSLSMTHQHDNKNKSDIRHTVMYRNGLKLSFNVDQWHNLGGLTGTYKEYLSRLPVNLESGDMVIDIGAHIGSFSVPLCWNNRDVNIYAFEPDPQNFKLLSFNLAQNELESNLKIAQKAVAGESGECEFMVGVTSTTGTMANAGYVKSQRCRQNKSIKVATISLEDIFHLNNIKRCRLLKLDCEGGEYEIFYTAADSTLEQIEFMVVEAHPIKAHKPIELKEFFITKGFIVNEEKYSNGCSMFYCGNMKTMTKNKNMHM